jgi:hypothetical protein
MPIFQRTCIRFYTSSIALLLASWFLSAESFVPPTTLWPIRFVNARTTVASPHFPTTVTASVDNNNNNNNNDNIAFPPPLTRVQSLQRAATFWSRTLPIVAGYYGLISQIKLQELMGSPVQDVERLWSEQHLDGAEKLARVVTELKGFYVKTVRNCMGGVAFSYYNTFTDCNILIAISGANCIESTRLVSARILHGTGRLYG